MASFKCNVMIEMPMFPFTQNEPIGRLSYELLTSQRMRTCTNYYDCVRYPCVLPYLLCIVYVMLFFFCVYVLLLSLFFLCIEIKVAHVLVYDFVSVLQPFAIHFSYGVS